LVLFFGGLFLLWKASKEIYLEVEAPHQVEEELEAGAAIQKTGVKLFWYSIIQIGILDIVFSLDSVITAVGMADDIEPEIIADAAIALAMRETVRMHGEDGAEAMLNSLRERMLAGEFSPESILQ